MGCGGNAKNGNPAGEIRRGLGENSGKEKVDGRWREKYFGGAMKGGFCTSQVYRDMQMGYNNEIFLVSD